ncbi:hypothetical protein Ahy_A03g014706 [Arachis hypogaea]|uniref:Replication protein A 70 kDa DNA-binding subunit B/D first OB fold domain-containing protein n=1 Tax=Arachis hypogaea TaxID=3818 RepID=A0A445DYL2_ARAHY|nr:hypothetical protein Ahy_A03g014706 [Arachis hypogaea]
MAGTHKIAEINPTIDKLCVRIRVIRLWTLLSYGNSSLPYSIEMGGKIHASVKRALVFRFVNLLKEGIPYQIRYFGVRLNEDILLKLRVKELFEKDDKSTKYTIIKLEIDDGKIMECAFFGNYAYELNFFLGSGNKGGAVVVLQFVRVKSYNRKIILQNFMYGTKMFFNLEEANVIQFKNTFIRFEESRGNIDAISNEVAFLKIYQAKTIEQLKELDTILQTGGTTNVNATGPPMFLQKLSNVQYRIKFGVIDDSNYAFFVVFDKEAKQILRNSCVEILDPLLLVSSNQYLFLKTLVKIFFMGGKIHASVKRALVSRFMNLLKEGISYQIIYFGVGLNEDNFKTTHHEYVVNLNRRTDVHRLPESSSIPRYEFNFVSFDTLNAPDYDYTYLVDVVEYFTEIGSKRTLKKDDKSTKYTIIELEIDDGQIIECAFFDNYVHKLNTFLGSDNKDGAVVVLQFDRVKLYNKKLFYRIPCKAQRCFSILKKQIFVRFEEPRDWWYDQCKCNSKYRIKLGVIDNSDYACFVKGDLSDIPTLLLNLINKTILFIVKVQISDNPHFSPSYKVKKMTDNMDLINKFKKAHSIQIMSTVISDFDYTGSLLPMSKASSFIEGEKIEGAKNLLLEFSNEVADNDESEVLENAITPTKRLSSESEDSKVQGDTSTYKKIKIENET